MRDIDVNIRHGAFLPHWTKEGAAYNVSFRLADSVPQERLAAWKEERKELLQKIADRKITPSEEQRLTYLLSEKIEHYLDAGHGHCWLRNPAIAQLVKNALEYFDGERYQLHAWCIMPNHVHVVLEPISHPLHEILRSWKMFTAREANKVLQRSGLFWQTEYFDHLIRNDESLERAVEYVWNNSDAAGLKNWEWRWRMQ